MLHFKPSGILYVSLLCILYSCDTKTKELPYPSAPDRLSLISADSAFSAKSAKDGRSAAFVSFLDNEGALLRLDQQPLVGADAMEHLLVQEDTSYTFTRKPQRAVISASSDIGYTYGVYVIQPHGVDTLMYGNYVSVWKKQNDSTWKIVLDSENAGLGLNDSTNVF